MHSQNPERSTCAQSQDRVICMPNLRISMNFDAVMPDSE